MDSSVPPSGYQSPKCVFTHGCMGYTDPTQPPSSSKPWAALAQFRAIYSVDLVLPQEVFDTAHRPLLEMVPPPAYHSVIMSLEQVLDRRFVADVVKAGNVTMISEGRKDADNTFSLIRGGRPDIEAAAYPGLLKPAGVLTIHLDQETYERAGLIGQPYGAKGKRNQKPGWIVECDLRKPSMAHGKRGFDKLVYAAQHVFHRPRRWLLCDLDEFAATTESLTRHFPVKFTSSPRLVEGIEAQSAPLDISSNALFGDNKSFVESEVAELYEWLSLIRLGSPRVGYNDCSDSYLSRYKSACASSTPMRLVQVSWQGFISPHWLRGTLVTLLSICSSKSWFALGACEFSSSTAESRNEVSLIRPPHAAGEYIMWEVRRGG